VAEGTDSSNLPLSAIQSVLFTYNPEMMANLRGTRGSCAQCEPEKAISLQIGQIPGCFLQAKKKRVASGFEALSMTSVRQAVRRIDPGLLERFQQTCAIAQDVPCSDGHRPFDLRSRQAPSLSIVNGGPVNEAFGDTDSVVWPSSLPERRAAVHQRRKASLRGDSKWTCSRFRGRALHSR